MSEEHNKYAKSLTLQEFHRLFLTEQPEELVAQAINYNTDIDWIESVEMGIALVNGEESNIESLSEF